MNCPNCHKPMTENYCMFCGYMKNGNFVKSKSNPKITDEEKYLGLEYDQILHQKSFLANLILGPLYLCYRKFFWTGFFLGILEILFLYLTDFIFSPFYFFYAYNLGVIMTRLNFIILRIFWIGFGNTIYLKLLKRKIKRIKNKKEIETYIINQKTKNRNIFYPIVAIMIYLIFYFIFR